MINENQFINQPTPEKKMDEKRTKEDAQRELMERFGLKKTSDFQLALQQGKIELAKEWLNYIIANQAAFPQYAETWDSWLNDRQREITLYGQMKEEGSLEKNALRTKEEARADLLEKFGFADTKGFRETLLTNLPMAEKWLEHIVANKMSFPQYLASWDRWLSDRQTELSKAKK